MDLFFLSTSFLPSIKAHLTFRSLLSASSFFSTLAHQLKIKVPTKKIAIFNDAFGALALSLNLLEPTVVSDSLLSQLAIESNAKLNNIELNIDRINSLSEFKKDYDYLFIKVPKTLEYLRDFLMRIKPFLQLDCKIIVAGMVKNTPNSVWKILEETMGPTSTSLAKKKAKLIFVTKDQKELNTPYPSYFMQENTAYKIFNQAETEAQKIM